MKSVLFVFFFFISFSLWGQNMCLQKEILLETDEQFAILSEKKGLYDALIEFMDDQCVLLTQFGYSINGKESVVKVLSLEKKKSKNNPPRWKPIYADVSLSNDFGYTFGRYQLSAHDSIKYEDIKFNYYGSIWKRQKNGSWKLIFHVGLLNIANEKRDESPFYLDANFSNEEKEIMAADRDFSNLSSEKGYFESFFRYIADDGLALSGNGRLPTNKEKFRQLVEHYKNNKPPAFKLTWKPIFAGMSQSGEIGFTHGRYQSISTDEEGKQSLDYGYYVSVWKKQPDGSWRFVLDGGNQSPAIENE